MTGWYAQRRPDGSAKTVIAIALLALLLVAAVPVACCGAVADVEGFGCVESPVDVAGLNVATDSIAPATRHTARMLASTGITVPPPANGPNGRASRFSRFLRRLARSSRR